MVLVLALVGAAAFAVITAPPSAPTGPGLGPLQWLTPGPPTCSSTQSDGQTSCLSEEETYNLLDNSLLTDGCPGLRSDGYRWDWDGSFVNRRPVCVRSVVRLPPDPLPSFSYSLDV